jgi:hypothetical protein
MTSRGVQKLQATLLTIRMLGQFGEQAQTRQEFLSAIKFAGVAGPGNLFLRGASTIAKKKRGICHAGARAHAHRGYACAR